MKKKHNQIFLTFKEYKERFYPSKEEISMDDNPKEFGRKIAQDSFKKIRGLNGTKENL